MDKTLDIFPSILHVINWPATTKIVAGGETKHSLLRNTYTTIFFLKYLCTDRIYELIWVPAGFESRMILGRKHFFRTALSR